MMKALLFLPLLVGVARGGATWNKKNCNEEGLNGAIVGNVVDAVCADYTECDTIQNATYGALSHKEDACNALPICLWDGGEARCKYNRDSKNNVCAPPGTSNQHCADFSVGKCPRPWQVKKACCLGSAGKYDGILDTDNNDVYVCCNTPCEALNNATVDQSDICKWTDHEHNAQCGPAGRSVFGGGYGGGYGGGPGGYGGGRGGYGGGPGGYGGHGGHGGPGVYGSGAIKQMFGLNPGRDLKYGNVVEGFGYQGLPGGYGTAALEEVGVGRSKQHHTEEITVDDLFETLIHALDTDRDVFQYDKEVNSDPWFNKQAFGGFTDQFSFIDPYKFIDPIYGSPFGLSQAKLAYGNMYGIDSGKFKNVGKGGYGGGKGGYGGGYGGKGGYGGGYGGYGGGPGGYGGGPGGYGGGYGGGHGGGYGGHGGHHGGHGGNHGGHGGQWGNNGGQGGFGGNNGGFDVNPRSTGNVQQEPQEVSDGLEYLGDNNDDTQPQDDYDVEEEDQYVPPPAPQAPQGQGNWGGQAQQGAQQQQQFGGQRQQQFGGQPQQQFGGQQQQQFGGQPQQFGGQQQQGGHNPFSQWRNNNQRMGYAGPQPIQRQGGLGGPMGFGGQQQGQWGPNQGMRGHQQGHNQGFGAHQQGPIGQNQGFGGRQQGQMGQNPGFGQQGPMGQNPGFGGQQQGPMGQNPGFGGQQWGQNGPNPQQGFGNQQHNFNAPQGFNGPQQGPGPQGFNGPQPGPGQQQFGGQQQQFGGQQPQFGGPQQQFGGPQQPQAPQQQGPPLTVNDVYPEQAHAHAPQDEFVEFPSLGGDFVHQEFTKKKK